MPSPPCSLGLSLGLAEVSRGDIYSEITVRVNGGGNYDSLKVAVICMVGPYHVGSLHLVRSAKLSNVELS